MNILQKLINAQLQLQSTQRNWDEECLFRCNDLLSEVISELENAEQSVQADTSPLCPECQCELHLTTAGDHVCRNETCGLYR